MEKKPPSPLFSGKLEYMGGLSNERELAKICPPQFKESNPWSNYAALVIAGMVKITNWKWKTFDEAEKQMQKEYLCNLIDTFDLSHEDKVAVAGWMLSEMLVEVPQHEPFGK